MLLLLLVLFQVIAFANGNNYFLNHHIQGSTWQRNTKSLSMYDGQVKSGFLHVLAAKIRGNK